MVGRGPNEAGAARPQEAFRRAEARGGRPGIARRSRTAGAMSPRPFGGQELVPPPGYRTFTSRAPLMRRSMWNLAALDTSDPQRYDFHRWS